MRLQVVYKVQLKVTSVTFKMIKHQREIEFKRILFGSGLLWSAHNNVIDSRNYYTRINKL